MNGKRWPIPGPLWLKKRKLKNSFLQAVDKVGSLKFWAQCQMLGCPVPVKNLNDVMQTGECKSSPVFIV